MPLLVVSTRNHRTNPALSSDSMLKSSSFALWTPLSVVKSEGPPLVLGRNDRCSVTPMNGILTGAWCTDRNLNFSVASSEEIGVDVAENVAGMPRTRRQHMPTTTPTSNTRVASLRYSPFRIISIMAFAVRMMRTGMVMLLLLIVERERERSSFLSFLVQ